MIPGLRSAAARLAAAACLAALSATACSAPPEGATATTAPAPTATQPPATGVFVRLWSGLGSPLAVVAAPGDPRVFVLDKAGRVLVSPDGDAQPMPWLDLSGDLATGSEQGLLGMALHPQFATNGRAFVNYTDAAGDTRVVEIDVDPSPSARAAVTARRELLFIDQPFANHNGGNLVFGPDGDLWIGTGDGGGAGDPNSNAQDRDSLLGKMLRLDVDAGGAPQVWAVGLRNPWRYSFDSSTGDLWIGDVGQNTSEEIDVVRGAATVGAGIDFGWPAREGDRVDPDRADTASPDAIAPVLTYPTHAGGTCAVTGGFVYRGPVATEYAGEYFFGDACSGEVWTTNAMEPGTATDVTTRLGLPPDLQVVSFGVDSQGRLYLVDLGGSVYRLESGN
ncbi:MAG: PQQ-dependent sugar dehydrogenase [Acidimicrobiia bacterium]|nr:PQQ-dependent sugar dehydrogenase [Acidimicrobiia bacterium]